MNQIKTLAIVLFLTFMAPHTFSQSVAPIQRDVAALQNLAAAIGAMGGQATVLSVQDSVVAGTMVPARGSPLNPGTFVWKTLGIEFRCEIQRNSATQVFATGHGHPAMLKNGKTTRFFYQVAQNALPFHLPAVVLISQLADSAISVSGAVQSTLGGREVFKIQMNSVTGDPLIAAVTLQTWYFDRATGLPLRVEYRLPASSDVSDWVNAASDFSDFRAVGGLMVPFSIAYSEHGAPLETFLVSTVNLNTGLSASEFDLAGGAQ